MRTFIRVLGAFDPAGNLKPVKIDVPGEGVFSIDRVLGMRTMQSTKAGGVGYRYSIEIKGRQSYLYFEPSEELKGNNIGRWFIRG